MNINAEHWQPAQLEAFLDGRLSASDELLLSEHLNDCERCRQTMDQVAAAAETWSRASVYLKDDAFDQTSVSQSSALRMQNTGSGLGDEQEAENDTLFIGPQIKQVLEVLSPTDDPQSLGRFGNYEVLGVVGAGGMGVVLKAYDRPLDRTVAIKVMAPHLALSGAARQRFSREARAAAAVLHPNVIAIFGVATDAVLPYLVMPYIGGASLQKRLDNGGPLPVEDVVRIGLQIAAGLTAAHGQGLVHRDIKPANILLDQGVERLVITDFGLARTVDDASVTRTGVIAGTPQFMSPEQVRGDAVDARSDLFSLGSVLYTACTGRVPFRAETPYGILRRITDERPRPIREINPQVPAWLCQLVERLLAKRPEDRYQSAERVATLLAECLAHLTQPTVHAVPRELCDEGMGLLGAVGRRLAIVAACCVALAGVVYAFWPDVGETEQPAVGPQTQRVEVQTANEQTLAGQTPNIAGAEEPEATVSATEDALLPWQDPESIDAWSDQLTPLFQHIEQALREGS